MSEINKFFLKEELEKMTNYQKLRFENQIEKYRKMEQLGCNPAKPVFMLREIKGEDSANQIVDDETVRKQEQSPKSAAIRRKKPRKNSDDGEWHPSVQMKRPNTARKPKRTVLQSGQHASSSGPGTSGIGGRHSKRIRSIPDYKEAYVPDCDDFIFCDECEREWEGECKDHPLHIVVDTPVPKNDSDVQRAIKTTPPVLKVDTSKIPGAGNGVWTRKVIPRRTRFGPYEGKIVPPNVSTGYGWQIRRNGKEHHCVDASQPNNSNWMRYVNCSRHVGEQNLMAYQYRGHLYYRTTRDIAPLEELLVYYGENYGRELGIETKEYHGENRVRLEELTFKCPTCKLSFTSPVYMERHQCHRKRKPLQQLDNEEEYSKEKKFGCGHCVARFTCKSKLEIHERTHTGEKPFECSFCDSRFAVKSTLVDHLRTHTGEKPLKCSFCDSRFAVNSTLVNHLRTHTGEKPFACEQCSARFAQSNTLAKHRLVHTGDRPHVCTQCLKSFTQKSNLAVHTRIHTGERPFGCPNCTARFVQKITLNNHLKKHIEKS